MLLRNRYQCGANVHQQRDQPPNDKETSVHSARAYRLAHLIRLAARKMQMVNFLHAEQLTSHVDKFT